MNTNLSSKKPIYKKKRFMVPLFIFLSVIILDIILILTTHGETKSVDITPLKNAESKLQTDQIKVMTINMAHGRGDGRNQIFQSNDVIKEKVISIGNLIKKHQVNVVAMQEADAPSWWSGKYSHVNKVGTVAGMTSAVQGLNVDGLGLHYGTAVITQLNVLEARQETFPKNFPSFSKGFVVATCEWPGDSTFTFDVISTHLDFASSKVRANQLSILSEYVNRSLRPVIIMGDFNTEINKPLLPAFLKETGLQTWKTDDTSIVTFPTLGTRIDWILVSPELEIEQQHVLAKVLSDHSIVEAVIKRKTSH